MAGLAFLLAILVLEQDVVGHRDLALALLVSSGALLLRAAHTPYAAHGRAAMLLYHAGTLLLLAGVAVIAVPPGELSAGRWVAISAASMAALTEATLMFRTLFLASSQWDCASTLPVLEETATVESRETPGEQLPDAPASEAPDVEDDEVDGAHDPAKPGPVDAAAKSFLTGTIAAFVTGIIVLRVGEDQSRELKAALIILGGLVPASVGLLATYYQWRNRAFAPLLAALGLLYWQWPWPKQAARRTGEAGGGSAVVGGAGAAVVVVIGGITIVGLLSAGSTLTGAWRTSEFVFVERENVVNDGPVSGEAWTITRQSDCTGPSCPLAVASDREDGDFELARDGETWVGTREVLGDCVRKKPPYRVVVRDGYDIVQTFRVTPQFESGESSVSKAAKASISLSESWTAKEKAKGKTCDETGSASYISNAARSAG